MKLDRNGKKTSKTATKGGKYTIWNVRLSMVKFTTVSKLT